VDELMAVDQLLAWLLYACLGLGVIVYACTDPDPGRAAPGHGRRVAPLARSGAPARAAAGAIAWRSRRRSCAILLGRLAYCGELG
jgi:hypothetical protein